MGEVKSIWGRGGGCEKYKINEDTHFIVQSSVHQKHINKKGCFKGENRMLQNSVQNRAVRKTSDISYC